MKKFNGVYSKTYSQPIENQTLVVDNVRYHLAKNKKSMIKVGNGTGTAQTVGSAAKSSTGIHQINSANKPSRTIKSSPAKSTPNRILKENNYQFVSRKSFKLLNKSKTKLILRRPSQFKFNRLNTAAVQPTKPISTATSSKFVARRPPDSYRKIYNSSHNPNGVPKSQLAKLQAAQQLRKKALKSSITCLNKKKNNKLKLCTDNTSYCMFFCRFGRCAKIDTCKYKHDKDKVAVCKNFLKGKCEVSGCLLTHKIDPKKMPVCSFYLKGICNIDNCPYRHVNVSVNAEICKDFVRGFCAKGDQCKLLHQYKCKACDNNQCTCKRTHKKKVPDDKATNGPSNGVPELIELSSDSDMEISDDERAFDQNLDFIPLVSDLPEVQDAEQVDRKPTKADLESDDSDTGRYRAATFHDYESDDSWFEEDEKNVSDPLSTKYIPQFLLN